MSATAAYTFDAEDRPVVPGALWIGGPGPAPNTPLPGLEAGKPAYMPIDVHRRRTYESDDHGWIEVKSRRNEKSGWRGAKKNNKARGAAKMTMEELIASLSGRSFLIASV